MTTDMLPRRQLIFATAGVMLALLLASLDQTIVGTAMPRIIAELNGLDYYAWVTTAYMVTSTVTIPIAGKLGDMFGRKPFLLAGMVGFVLASALCGQAQNMLMLVLFRGLQGLFGGVLFASVFSVIADLFPPDRRARIQGVFGAIFGLSSVIGPTVGGYLTDNLSWRWVFYVNVPVGIAAVTVVALSLPYVRSRASWRDIDFLGSGLLAAGLVPLLIALSITRNHSWGDWQVLSLLGLAAVMLVAFFLEERRAEHPIVPFNLFRNRAFAVSMIVGFLTAFGMFGTIIFVSLDFQGVLGISVTNSGLLITPMMFGLIVASTLTGLLMTRIRQYRFLGTLGVAIMILGLVMLAQVTVGTTQFEVTRDIVVIGAGLGITFPLYINALQSALPRQYLGVGSSQIQFWRNIGGTVSTAVMGSFLARLMPEKVAEQINKLNLPQQFRGRLNVNGSAGAQQTLDPKQLAAARSALPAQFQPLFDQAIHAVKLGIAATLHDIYLLAAVILVAALIATLFMPVVPLARRGPAKAVEDALEEPAPVEVAAG